MSKPFEEKMILFDFSNFLNLRQTPCTYINTSPATDPWGMPASKLTKMFVIFRTKTTYQSEWALRWWTTRRWGLYCWGVDPLWRCLSSRTPPPRLPRYMELISCFWYSRCTQSSVWVQLSQSLITKWYFLYLISDNS